MQPIGTSVFLQIFRNVSMKRPRRDDRRYTVMAKHAVKFEDVRTRYVLPYNRLVTKTLFLAKLSHVYVLGSLSTHTLTFLSFVELP